MPKYLVTGAAGFIGLHVSRRLLERGNLVVGLDNLNDYYSVKLKRDRLEQLSGNPAFTFEKLDIVDRAALPELFAREQFEVVIHLAAQAGVRHSLKNPSAYIDSNVVGFANVLEACRRFPVKHLVYASSSSVYGANRKLPFAVHDSVDHPVSLYAATKKADELLAHAYSHLYGLPTTGLRFFTVYGPWGRPDMALWIFVDSIINGRPIDVFNHGEMRRDLTYIDDVTECVVRVADGPPLPDPQWSAESPDPGTSFAPYRIYNIGNNQPVELTELIATIEKCVGRTAQKRSLPLQPGDMTETYADIADLVRDFNFRPTTPIKEGVARFVEWFRGYHHL